MTYVFFSGGVATPNVIAAISGESEGMLKLNFMTLLELSASTLVVSKTVDKRMDFKLNIIDT